MATPRRAAADNVLGSYVRRLRKERGMSQEDLAESMDVSQETVSAIERGVTTDPQPTTMRRLATALGVDLADIIIASNQARTRADAQRIAESSPEYAAQDEDTARVVRLMGGMTDAQRRSVYNFARYIARTKTRPRKARPTVLRESA